METNANALSPRQFRLRVEWRHKPGALGPRCGWSMHQGNPTKEEGEACKLPLKYQVWSSQKEEKDVSNKGTNTRVNITVFSYQFSMWTEL